MNRSLDAEAATAAIARLVAAGVLEPVSDAEDAQVWLDTELASLVENRFHMPINPLAMTRAERESWMTRALTPDERLVDPREETYRAGFWTLAGRRRVGTLAIETRSIGAVCLRLSSLYVFPSERGRGIAARVMRSAQDAAVGVGFAGIRVATHWTWQAAVRFYLSTLGMWACSFKRSIDFVWVDRLAPYRIAIQEDDARLTVTPRDGRPVDLLTATRNGDWLVWTEAPLMSRDEDVSPLYVEPLYARATFAVALAIAGWPLLRAPQAFDDARGYDIGGPEVLANKIGVFEHLDRRYGFDVRTPRIPGLPYDTIAQRFETE